MTKYRLFSADSHVSEPLDLWVERIDARLQFVANGHFDVVEERDQRTVWLCKVLERHNKQLGRECPSLSIVEARRPCQESHHVKQTGRGEYMDAKLARRRHSLP